MLKLKGLLVRIPQSSSFGLTDAEPALTSNGVKYDFTKLFEAPSGSSLGLSGASSVAKVWYSAVPASASSALAGRHPWDEAHAAYELMLAPSAAGTAAPDLIEPDFVQDWPTPLRTEADTPLAAADACDFENQDESLPFVKDQFAWHLGDAYSQLRSARKQIPSTVAAVRIVHLDTGYDPNHVTYPTAAVQSELQRNFVDDDKPKDARDYGSGGPLASSGHGTGTLSILAGGDFAYGKDGYHFGDVLGGAPLAKVVPVRVGNSVVQFSTASVAKGISYAVDLCGKSETRVDVISMSMGGLASAAWADAVNRAYEAGILFVAAAGNAFSVGGHSFPTHHIVYPARFGRVVAACGVMADSKPYYGLKTGKMQGNWGPAKKMKTAMSAFTPNIAWARWECKDIVRMNGQGTSSATPQIAAAAALYFQAHFAELFDRTKYPQPWMRVEAVRQALFGTARLPAPADEDMLGRGILQAADALKTPPASQSLLQKTPVDSASHSFLRVLTGLGVTDTVVDRMLQLEATQLAQRWDKSQGENPLATAVADPDGGTGDVSTEEIRRYLTLLIDHPDASKQLKRRAREALGLPAPPRPPSPPPVWPPEMTKGGNADPKMPRSPTPEKAEPTEAERLAKRFVPPFPTYRLLRGYSLDPSLATTLDTAQISEMEFKVPWEPLDPGPIGEYLEVIDVDPSSKCFYDPVNLEDPSILAQRGLSPGEGTPQFHQQMVYAVASLTIDNFEKALGRKTLWRPGPPKPGRPEEDDSNYVRRLRIYPHALREKNAYYSPQRVALLFGYFDAGGGSAGDYLPGGKVFSCLSHDIIAHETTHALLDGLHRRFLLASNPDVRAFHEAFADCVALLQHFSFSELVKHVIAATRGRITDQENLLSQLAVQFGRSTSRKTALRDAIGTMENGVWKPHKPDPAEYETVLDAHARGGILVAAVFDAFLSIYRRRTADLVRLASGGTGILNDGALHPDLTNRLANEAAKTARHVLRMCIRALDYCPPTDITFGEYLRAVITADHDLISDDDLFYRVSFIEAFRKRGIYPDGVRTLSTDSLLWLGEGMHTRPASNDLRGLVEEFRVRETSHMRALSRERIFWQQYRLRRDLHNRLRKLFETRNGRYDAELLGIDLNYRFQVHTARFLNRTGPDDELVPQLIVGLLQHRKVPVNSADRNGPTMEFEGGCTIVIDLRTQKIQYCIRKNTNSPSRQFRQQQFALREFDRLQATYFGSRFSINRPTQVSEEPFAMLHRST